MILYAPDSTSKTALHRFLSGFGLQRAITHVALALFTVLGVYVTTRYAPRAEAAFVFVLAFGYVCLLLLAAVLLIGPINLLRQRFNPVNIDLRRDLGIWAGITGCLHVIFALIENGRGNILHFFFRPNGLPLLNLSGISNYTGAVATVLLVLLLALSNTFSLRKLKGKRWKRLQRLNYWLTGLTFFHVFGYQMISGREQAFPAATAIAVVFILFIQLVGVAVYQKRKAAHLPRSN